MVETMTSVSQGTKPTSEHNTVAWIQVMGEEQHHIRDHVSPQEYLRYITIMTTDTVSGTR